ncbi:NAD(P)H-binding protein [Limosilactobacillus alvi]|uniref:NAD(P)H-binding protein n=1 Tax=Limosilactobacillus alvi TaxID=990412 RepID=UPI003D162C18
MKSTGQTSKLVLKKVLQAGHQVIAYVRSPGKLNNQLNLPIIKGNLWNQSKLINWMKQSIQSL